MALAKAHRDGRADVAVRATSASDSLRNNTFPGRHDLVEDNERPAGPGDLPVLPTPAVCSLTYRDRRHSVDARQDRPQNSAPWHRRFPGIEEGPWLRVGPRHCAKSRTGPK